MYTILVIVDLMQQRFSFFFLIKEKYAFVSFFSSSHICIELLLSSIVEVYFERKREEKIHVMSDMDSDRQCLGLFFFLFSFFCN